MENRAHAIVAVVFLVVFATGAVLIFYWLSSGPGEPRHYRIVTRQSVAGLAPQAGVRFKGLLIGHVDSIRFDPQDPSRVIVDFRVRQDAYVAHNSYAILATQGLIGGKVLQLKLGAGNNQPLATSAQQPAHIPLRPDLLAQLKASAQQNLQTLHAVLTGAKDIVGQDNRQHITTLLRQLDVFAAKLVTLEQQLTPAAGKLPQVLTQAQQTLAQAQTLLASTNKLVEQAQAPLQQVGTAAQTVHALGDRLDARVLPDARELIKNLTRTSRQLQDLLSELEARPQSLLFGPPAPRPGPGEPGFNAHGSRRGSHE